MRSFIRVNGYEHSAEGRAIDGDFNQMVVDKMRVIFGEKSQFNIVPTKNFIKEDQTDNIFSGVISGQYEGEAPVSITVYHDLPKSITEYDLESLPEPDIVIPAFIGFRK